MRKGEDIRVLPIEYFVQRAGLLVIVRVLWIPK